mgnify:CR=1 FL=1
MNLSKTKDFDIVTDKNGDKWLQGIQIIDIQMTGQELGATKEEILRINLSEGILHYSYNLKNNIIFVQCGHGAFKIHGNGQLLDKEIFY